jgi:hypothetical protein
VKLIAAIKEAGNIKVHIVELIIKIQFAPFIKKLWTSIS